MNAKDNRSQEEQQLVDKLRKIEALFARPGTEGERVAAGHAAERIRARLQAFKREEPDHEHQFSIHDPWARMLFLALVRRYGLYPYRHKGQRRTTILIRVQKRFVDETLWPEFRELQETLQSYLNEVTQRVISEAIHSDVRDADEQSAPAGRLLPGGDGLARPVPPS